MTKKHTPHVVTWLKRRKLRPTRLVLQDGRPVLYYEPEPPKRKPASGTG